MKIFAKIKGKGPKEALRSNVEEDKDVIEDNAKLMVEMNLFTMLLFIGSPANLSK